jgi:superfamily II DNA or RNA helicase
MSVVIRVQNVELFLDGFLDKAIRDEIQRALSYTVPNFQFVQRYKQDQQKAAMGLLQREPWDGSITVARRYYSGNGILRMPTGLLSYLREILDKHGIMYEMRDERSPPLKMTGWATNGLVLRDYQVPIKEALLRRQRGVLKMATGSGKTELLVDATVSAACFPSVFYVASCDLLEQAYDRFRKYVIHDGSPAEIGRVGAGHCDIRPITIATVQSAQRIIGPKGKYTKNSFDDYGPDDKTSFTPEQRKAIKDMILEAQFVYVDEAHHVAAETIQDILNASCGARFRIGGSASPWRDDGLDILIEACFGRRICDVTASFLINQGYLVRPHITFNHFNQQLGAAMDWQSHYSTYIVENEARNQWIADRASMHVNNGRPTIVLVKWTRHAEILRDLIVGSEIATSSGEDAKSPKKRKELLDRMRRRELMCIIGTSLMDEGVDIPSARAGIFAGGGKSSSRELQRVGRFMRKDPSDPNKDCAYIEEFHEHTRWLSHQAKMRRQILETEREFDISDNRVI